MENWQAEVPVRDGEKQDKNLTFLIFWNNIRINIFNDPVREKFFCANIKKIAMNDQKI